MCRPPGRSSAPATSTATARPTCSGAIPRATSWIWLMNSGGVDRAIVQSSATSRPHGRSPAPATSTATARATFSGTTPPATPTIWFMNGGTISEVDRSRHRADDLVGGRRRRLQRRRHQRHSLARHLRRRVGLGDERRQHQAGCRASAMLPTNWSIVGTGDFNGDGTSDILWRDTAGDVMIWLISNGDAAAAIACSAMCRRRGALPRPATSTATARATFSGSTPPAT